VRLAVRVVPLAALLSAVGCGTWFDKDAFSPSSPSVVGALQLERSPAAIPADGFSTTLVTATLSADAALTHRTVVFATTAGTFAGAPDDGRTLERTVELSTSTATAQLRSSRTVEVARVTATVKDVPGLGREVLVTFTAPTVSDIITVSAPASALADGATITPVTAEISGALPADRRTVRFTTTFGGFVGDPNITDGSATSSTEADADGGNRAVAYLRSPSSGIGVAFVTARVDSTPAVSATTQVQFTRAAAQQVLVTVDKAALTQDDTSSLMVTATLVREPGVPTEGTIVTFRAVDEGGVERGLFTKVERSNASGVATAEYSPGSLTPIGRITISASADGHSDSAQVQIVAVPP
jgi:hypothetical protein